MGLSHPVGHRPLFRGHPSCLKQNLKAPTLGLGTIGACCVILPVESEFWFPAIFAAAYWLWRWLGHLIPVQRYAKGHF